VEIGRRLQPFALHSALVRAMLVTTVRVYDLGDANRALQDLKHSRIDGAGVLRVS
jgi:hypothetical protein